MDALQEFANRPRGLRNPAIKEHAESLLENVANPHISDENLMPFVLHLLRIVEVRVEPYINSPVKGVVSIPLDDPALDEVRKPLALAVTKVMRNAIREASLKVLVDRQPG
jgi:hypothetical protein